MQLCNTHLDIEDELDFSADEESNYSPDEEDLDTTGNKDIGERQGELQGERRRDLNIVSSDTLNENGSSQINMKRNLLWRKRSLIFSEKHLQLLASTALPPEHDGTFEPYTVFHISVSESFAMRRTFIFVKRI